MESEVAIAIHAMYNAAAGMRVTDGVKNVSVDNDNDSGEILFDVGDRIFRLKLEDITE